MSLGIDLFVSTNGPPMERVWGWYRFTTIRTVNSLILRQYSTLDPSCLPSGSVEGLEVCRKTISVAVVLILGPGCCIFPDCRQSFPGQPFQNYFSLRGTSLHDTRTSSDLTDLHLPGERRNYTVLNRDLHTLRTHFSIGNWLRSQNF